MFLKQNQKSRSYGLARSVCRTPVPPGRNKTHVMPKSWSPLPCSTQEVEWCPCKMAPEPYSKQMCGMYYRQTHKLISVETLQNALCSLIFQTDGLTMLLYLFVVVKHSIQHVQQCFSDIVMEYNVNHLLLESVLFLEHSQGQSSRKYKMLRPCHAPTPRSLTYPTYP